MPYMERLLLAALDVAAPQLPGSSGLLHLPLQPFLQQVVLLRMELLSRRHLRLHLLHLSNKAPEAQRWHLFTLRLGLASF